MEKSAQDSTSRTTHAVLLSDTSFLAVVSIGLVSTLGINVASAGLPSITEALVVPSGRAGLIVTAYTLPALLMVPVSGVVADVYGRRVVVLPSLVLFSLAGGAITLAGNFETILAFRVLQGLAAAGMMPLTVTVLGDLYTGTKGTTAQGIRVASLGINSISIPVLVGYLSGFAWRYPFYLYLLGLPATAFVYTYLPETAAATDDDQPLGRTLREYLVSLKAGIRDTNTSVLISGGFARDFIRYTLLTFVPLYAVASFDSPFVAAGAIISVRGVAQLAVSPLAGVIATRLTQKWALVGAVGVGVASTVLLPFAPNLPAVIAIFALYSAGDAVFSPVIKDMVTDTTTTDQRAGVISSMKVLNYAGQTAGPAFFGLVLALAGYDVVFGLSAACLAVYGGVLVALLHPDELAGRTATQPER